RGAGGGRGRLVPDRACRPRHDAGLRRRRTRAARQRGRCAVSARGQARIAPAVALALAAASLCACQAVAGIKLHHYVDADGGDNRDGSTDKADGGTSPLCAEYCKKISNSPLCQHEYAVYTEEKECLSLCAKLPPGKESDRKANSVGCRLYWAGIVGE